jgi:hypothetical protein
VLGREISGEIRVREERERGRGVRVRLLRGPGEAAEGTFSTGTCICMYVLRICMHVLRV